MQRVIVSILACALFTSAAVFAGDTSPTAPAASDATPDGTVTLKGGSVAAGIGFTWGHGDLSYRDSAYQFSINGVSVVDVGATSYSASGVVYNLKQLADFSGNYVAAGAGIAIGGGGTAVYLKNEHGVVIKLIATDVGFKFKLSTDGVHVTLKS